MNLYRVYLQATSFPSSGMAKAQWVVADNPDIAYQKVKTAYEKHGFEKDRLLKSVELIAEDKEYADIDRLFL